MSGNSLINLGELSKPATVLVEKISEAVGGVFKPYQIRRIARAEADAERIRAQTQIEVSDLQRRAVQRWLSEEAKRQDNIETITAKALPDVSETAEPDRVDEDWITNFFDKARLISNREMQALWAKILAGEANHPGTYSKRTVDFLASLDTGDAQLFTRLCGFCWDVGSLVPLVFDLAHQIYARRGVTYESIIHLDNIGLLHYDAFDITFNEFGKQETVWYFGQPVDLQFSDESGNSLATGHVLLTRVGKELAPICGSKPVPRFMEYVLYHWLSEGITPSSPFPRSTTMG
jgi:hypothetical protein